MQFRFIDVNRLLAPCVQIPRQETPRTADTKISYMIQLKHVLGLVGLLRNVLEDCESALTKAYCLGLADKRFSGIIDNIESVSLLIYIFKNPHMRSKLILLRCIKLLLRLY